MIPLAFIGWASAFILVIVILAVIGAIHLLQRLGTKTSDDGDS